MPLNPNVSGQAYALMVLTPITPGREQELRDLLEGYTEASSPLARLPRTHFGRWVILDDFVRDATQPKPDADQTRKGQLSITGAPASGSNPVTRKAPATARESLDRSFASLGLG